MQLNFDSPVSTPIHELMHAVQSAVMPNADNRIWLSEATAAAIEPYVVSQPTGPGFRYESSGARDWSLELNYIANKGLTEYRTGELFQFPDGNVQYFPAFMMDLGSKGFISAAGSGGLLGNEYIEVDNSLQAVGMPSLDDIYLEMIANRSADAYPHCDDKTYSCNSLSCAFSESNDPMTATCYDTSKFEFTNLECPGESVNAYLELIPDPNYGGSYAKLMVNEELSAANEKKSVDPDLPARLFFINLAKIPPFPGDMSLVLSRDEQICPECGDGVVEGSEECDDGNIIDGDGCSAYCKTELLCGNGSLDGIEQCDDGNNISGDGCNSECKTEAATLLRQRLQIRALGSINLGAGSFPSELTDPKNDEIVHIIDSYETGPWLSTLRIYQRQNAQVIEDTTTYVAPIGGGLYEDAVDAGGYYQNQSYHNGTLYYQEGHAAIMSQSTGEGLMAVTNGEIQTSTSTNITPDNVVWSRSDGLGSAFVQYFYDIVGSPATLGITWDCTLSSLSIKYTHPDGTGGTVTETIYAVQKNYPDGYGSTIDPWYCGTQQWEFGPGEIEVQIGSSFHTGDLINYGDSMDPGGIYSINLETTPGN
jgi:cysteine-rich repeat protein